MLKPYAVHFKFGNYHTVHTLRAVRPEADAQKQLWSWSNQLLRSPEMKKKSNIQNVLSIHLFNYVSQYTDHKCTFGAQSSSIKTWFSQSGVEELDRSALSPYLNFIQHLWEELER